MKYLKLTSLVLLLVAATSCTDLLNNAEPSTSISQQKTLTSAGAVNAVRASMYVRLQTQTYSTQYMLGPSALADDFVNRASATRYAGYVENSENVGMSSWFTSYDLINDANIIVNGVKDGTLSDAKDDQYTGEALALRAFAYHHLVRTFGYEPGKTPSSGGPGAGFKKGVIVRTQPTLDTEQANYRPRKNVSEVYDQIIDDLNRSIKLLGKGDAGNPSYMTKAGAQALMARVQLYAGNYQKANDYAADAVSNSTASLQTTKQGIVNMFDESVSLNPEAIFVADVDPNKNGIDEALNNSLSVYTSLQYNALVPTQDLMNQYNTSDYRLAWFSQCTDGGNPVSGCQATYPTIQNGSVKLELDKWAQEQGQYADDIPFFRVPEMLMIQAEAREKGASGSAIAPLNKLRNARGLSNYTGSNVMDEVLKQRRLEFVGEGQRYFDLKRLKMTIPKDPATISTVVDPVKYTNNRILDNIPYNEVSLSEQNTTSDDSVLVQNPGY